MRRGITLAALLLLAAVSAAQTKKTAPPPKKTGPAYAGKPSGPVPAKPAPVEVKPSADGIVFTDVTKQLGITWEHHNGATPEKYFIETMGGGGAFLDYDKDGRLDILLVNSGCHKFSGPKCVAGHTALYRQNADGSFTDVTIRAGLKDTTYGMGVAVGDYDNDGYPDILITGFDHNTLWHNRGNGTFEDVTAKAAINAIGWFTSALWFDYDKDGRPDLYIGRYLEWDYPKNIWCGETRPGYRTYCHPNQFKEVPNVLYHNNGDGTFTDASEKAHVNDPGKTLGVVAFDYNRDGWPDLYVANDAVRNQLYKNNGDGTFTEVGMITETAYGSGGKPLSGMGTDAADIRGEGYPDLFVTNLDYEPNTFFRNNADDTFTDNTVIAGMGTVALLYSGFGARFVDFNNDGYLDLVVANGHPLDNIHLYHDGVTAAERPFLLENDGKGKFEEVGLSHGEAWAKLINARGLATGDFDNDGDTDLLIVGVGSAPMLLRNDGGNRNPWIGFELVGSASGKDAVGALVTVTVGGKKLVREKVGGASYESAHDPRILVGLGKFLPEGATKIDSVEIKWPSGQVTKLEGLAIRKYHVLTEPKK